MSTQHSRIVVGVDGTERSVIALRWAAFEALQRDAELVAVHAFGSHVRPAPYAPAGVAPAATTAAADARALLDDCVRAAFRHGLPMSIRPVCDVRRPVPALLDHGRGATLLVLAGRPDPLHKGVLGAIALDCLRHAPCPVVLVPIAASTAPSQPIPAHA